MNLCNAKINNQTVIIALSGNCDALRSYGFCEKIKITKLKDGRNIVCTFCGSKVAISKNLAQCVIVEESTA